MTSFFVTGTDTEVGKTLVSSALLHAFNLRYPEKIISAYKPIAAGADTTVNGLRNEDGVALAQFSSSLFTYDQINPVVYEAAIAPHIAAAQQGEVIDEAVLSTGLKTLQQQADIVLVEGAGGWHVPISDRRSLSHWVADERLPVILVVGVKLGCLNHAMLTVQAIKQQGLPIVGWVANMLTAKTAVSQANVDYLAQQFNFPLIGQVPYKKQITPQFAVDYLDLSVFKR